MGGAGAVALENGSDLENLALIHGRGGNCTVGSRMGGVVEPDTPSCVVLGDSGLEGLGFGPGKQHRKRGACPLQCVFGVGGGHIFYQSELEFQGRRHFCSDVLSL